MGAQWMPCADFNTYEKAMIHQKSLCKQIAMRLGLCPEGYGPPSARLPIKTNNPPSLKHEVLCSE